MYHEERRVATMIKTVEGFNNDVKRVLFESEGKAKRVKYVKDLKKFFWVFEEKEKRPEFYGE